MPEYLYFQKRTFREAFTGRVAAVIVGVSLTLVIILSGLREKVCFLFFYLDYWLGLTVYCIQRNRFAIYVCF